MRKKTKKLSAAILSVLLLCTVLCAGCTGLFTVKVSGISLSSEEIKLELGNRIELNPYVTVSPAKATDKSFTAESDDESVVTVESRSAGGVVSQWYLCAVGVGDATVTVRTKNGKSDSMDVVVRYAQPDEIMIRTAENLTVLSDTVVMRATAITPVTMSATLGQNVDPLHDVEWKVTGAGEHSGLLAATDAFTFTPHAVGQYTVTASVYDTAGKKISDVMKVNVYDEVSGASVHYDTSLAVQKAGEYRTVTFTMTYDPLPDGNPAPIVQWFVNDVLTGEGTAFGFLPSSPGLYTVVGKVNGVPAVTQDGDGTVCVRGVIVPQNVYVDYDNCYPNVYIRWDPTPAAAGYEISIVDKASGREIGTDISTKNTAIRDKFTDSGFDATGYMTGEYNIFSHRFIVKVKTLGDDSGMLSESDWSQAYTTPSVSERARSYLENTFYDGARNHYVRSYEEFYEWFEYAMLWRPAELTSGVKLYLDYGYGSAIDTIERAMNEMHFTGLYSYAGTSDIWYNRECTFRILFESAGTPSLRTERHSGEAWGSLRPHVNYDADKARSSRYVFPIDSRVPVTVETSDQLYYIAQLGYQPVPVSGSVAEKLYNYARRTLRYIITDDMTDVEKIHAIYDWIMWRVIYDNEVLAVEDLATAVKYESYYMESVFTDTYNYGVCDAMSKAFVLMCSIEGFESIRVTGMAGSRASERGGHAWNKVKLYGNWYVCDCTWGDASMQIMSGGAYREAATHMYFLVSDADIADTHAEDEGSSFPATARMRYPWYDDDFTYDGQSIDFYLAGDLGGESALRAELDMLAAYMIEHHDDYDKIYSVGPDAYVNRTTTSYYAYEIVSDSRWGSSDISALRRNFVSVMEDRGYILNRHYYLRLSTMGNMTHMFVFFRL